VSLPFFTVITPFLFILSFFHIFLFVPFLRAGTTRLKRPHGHSVGVGALGGRSAAAECNFYLSADIKYLAVILNGSFNYTHFTRIALVVGKFHIIINIFFLRVYKNLFFSK
jgi:hypothetical protein